MTRLAYLAFHSRCGGAELCLLSLLDGLDRARFSPIVVLSGEGPLADELRRRDVPAVLEPRMRHIVRDVASPATVAANLADFVHVLRSLRRVLRAEGTALVHAFVTPALKYGGVLARLTGTPAVASMHDLLAPPFSWLKRRYIATNVNLFYERLIVPSRAGRAAALGAGVAPAKLVVIPNGVDTARFARDEAARARLRAELGLGLATLVVGMVGRFVPIKGHDVLLRALAAVARRRPDVRGLIVGDAVFEGEEAWKTRVHALTRELGLASRVVFTGWRADVPALLSALDVFVQPATEGDSFPTTILEAMAAEAPIVAARGGPAPEMIEDGVTGTLVASGDPGALGDAILRLLDDPRRAARMAAAGRAKAEREFGRERHCRAVEALYETCLRAGRAPGAPGRDV